MSNTIRIKRRASGAAGAPSSLENAELAFNEVGDVLYYGKGTGGAGGSATTVEAIGGSGAFLALSGTQTVTGNKTFLVLSLLAVLLLLQRQAVVMTALKLQPLLMCRVKTF